MAKKPPFPATNYQMIFPSDAVSFDAEKFDELIRSQGVEMVHWRAMRCPVGMVDPDDVMRRPHEHHKNCSNGFVYTLAGTVTCGFLGNSNNVSFIDAGHLDGSTVQVVLPRFYDDKPEIEVDFANFDRVYLKEEKITVSNWNVFAASLEGVDKLQFPAVAVIDLMDSHGRSYHEGVDFDVKQGRIHWIDGKSPGIDPKTGKGVVCSARYTYRPFWYVKSLIHEVRVAQVEDDYGDRRVTRMPQAASLQREYFFEKEQNDAETADSQRKKTGPDDGGFGPR
jgi:hypothetical protein